MPEPRQASLAALPSEHGIEHLDHEALLGSRQALDALDLLLQLGGRPALGGLHVLFADEFFERDGERLGDLRQKRDRHAESADLVVE